MAATRANVLLLGLLAARSHAETCELDDRRCVPSWNEEAVDNDVHEVQLVQLPLVEPLRHPVVLQVNESHGAGAAAAALVPPAGGEFGSAGCICIGIAWPGETEALVDGVPVTYPASIGSECKAWDQGRDPACDGTSGQPAYCSQTWCFVDGCECNTTDVPKISSYFPNATFQGATLYYSYETCGSEDTWTSSKNKGACVNQDTKAGCTALSKCSWDGNSCKGEELTSEEACENPAPVAVIGNEACSCIGISNISGTIQATIDNKQYDYPAELGSSCDTWDSGVHPLCLGTPTPFWCKQRWCYVDPCSCHIDVVPKRLTYVPDATFQGRPLFYSYRTCGEVDTYSAEENAAACPTRPSQFQCEQGEHCKWVGSRGCVHNDILAVCGVEGLDFEGGQEKSAADLKTLAGLAALVVGLAAGN